MFFGNEHLGKAVAFLRESQDLKQNELAAKIGLQPGTLNQYETGRRGMNEEMVKKIATALEVDLIKIWDTAFRIFRYNLFQKQADEEKISFDELIARVEMKPSVEQLLESYDSKTERDRKYQELTFRFLDSLGKTGLEGSSLLRLVVKPRIQKASPKKAVRLGPQKPRRRES